jgi:hypothetical protein
MTLLGFNGETSLYQTSIHYGFHGGVSPSRRRHIPAASLHDPPF